ncbi:MAG: hypothetical protein RLZZ303_2496 [Candidatus Hydrogenedentota bacterium]
MEDTAAPRVSIIMPAFNAASCIGESVASVQAQTFADWELIIIDDGSDDDTDSIALEFSRHDSRIRVLPQEVNSGLPARVRNRGFATARGSLIALLDSDDIWLPDKLEKQVALLDATPQAGAVCCLYSVFGDEERATIANRLLNHELQSPVRRHEMLRYCAFQTSTVLFRREVLDTLGPMNENPALRSVEDYEFFIRMVHHFRVDRIPEQLVQYRIYPLGESLSTETMQAGNERGWSLYTCLRKQGLLSRDESRRFRAALHYEDAKDRLFHLREPFRQPLMRAVREGKAPVEALGMFSLCWLPSSALRFLLPRLLTLRNLTRRLRAWAASRARASG